MKCLSWRRGRALACAALAALLASCASVPITPPTPNAATSAPAAAQTPSELAKLDRALEDRILALDPDAISDADVRDVLAKGPTPRILLIHGGVYPVHLLMESFAHFLEAMGYPIERIRGPDGSLSISPYGNSEEQASSLAWYYEHEGVRPMLVGHSQGGIQVVKLLHELNGTFSKEIYLYDPVSGQVENRTWIVDPLTHQRRPVVGCSVVYASTVGTGGWSLALPIHWNVFPVIRSIPDSVDMFTGYRIGVDLFAWDMPGFEGLKTFEANGKAQVRNVTLPASYSHVLVPLTGAKLARDPAARAWIDAYLPAKVDTERDPEPFAGRNIVWAADVWYGIKKAWAFEAQRVVRARRAGPSSAAPARPS